MLIKEKIISSERFVVETWQTPQNDRNGHFTIENLHFVGPGITKRGKKCIFVILDVKNCSFFGNICISWTIHPTDWADPSKEAQYAI